MINHQDTFRPLTQDETKNLTLDEKSKSNSFDFANTNQIILRQRLKTVNPGFSSETKVSEWLRQYELDPIQTSVLKKNASGCRTPRGEATLIFQT